MKRKLFTATLILLATLALTLLQPTLQTKTGTITLLTVSETAKKGGTATLQLFIKPGTGSIFLDSLPLSRLDTQSSTRYANQIACDYLDKDCSQYDFFYRIRADSNIVGGPSAGAAIAILTISTLTGTPLKDDVAITGTINSGGIIGPVAGITAKARAAKEAGFHTVLIPKFEIPVNDTNETIEGITLIPVSTLDEALLYFTEKTWNTVNGNITPPPSYTQRMQFVAKTLCQQTKHLQETLLQKNILLPEGKNYTKRASMAQQQGNYYSQASLCFSNNLQLRTALLNHTTKKEQLELFVKTRNEAIKLEHHIDTLPLTTITDLETYIIVKERIRDAKERVALRNAKNLTADNVAYAIERLNSARSWTTFFGMPGKKISLEQDNLKEACREKISEAEERISYAELYFPQILRDAKKDLSAAYGDAEQGAYALCLFSASRAKAKANLFSSLLGVNKNLIGNVTQEKLATVEKLLIKQQQRNTFPILGYSYYEYAKELLPYDPASAITFAEYALELGNLAPYFPEKKNTIISKIKTSAATLTPYLLGLLGGIAFATFLNYQTPNIPARTREKTLRRRRQAQRRTQQKKSSNNKKRTKKNA
ncbi:hypothetical protein D6783_02015 [Candidatus Woesearchaeota archaeon]|nr:MAG: hypothetical protein D6783_02015 [Candidatus Woesearchaeota archaeon]